MMCAWRRSGVCVHGASELGWVLPTPSRQPDGRSVISECVREAARRGVQPSVSVPSRWQVAFEPEPTVLFSHQMQTDTSARGAVASAESERAGERARACRGYRVHSVWNAPPSVFLPDPLKLIVPTHSDTCPQTTARLAHTPTGITFGLWEAVR